MRAKGGECGNHEIPGAIQSLNSLIVKERVLAKGAMHVQR
eukprot:SAG31_NODE_868_length_11355_cov_4.658582_12_plen_40_part_00